MNKESNQFKGSIQKTASKVFERHHASNESKWKRVKKKRDENIYF
jgi:hypothetical protein